MGEADQDGGDDFARLMARAGVKPIGKPPGGRQKRKAAEPAEGRAVATPGPPPPVAPSPAPPTAPPAAPLPPEEDPQLVRLRAEEILRLQEALQVEKDARQGLEEELALKEAALEETRVHRASLQRALGSLQAEEVPASRSLGEALRQRGLLGEDEAARLLRGLLDQRRIGPLLQALEVTDPEAFDAYLEERLVLLGGCEACPEAGGRVVIEVPKARCEICEGGDIRRIARGFVDQLLLQGIRSVVIVGGSPRYHRQLRELVQHRQITLHLIPGNVRRTLLQAKADEDRAQLVILWGATLLDHSVSDLYGRGPARLLRIAHRGIGRMLALAGEQLAASG